MAKYEDIAKAVRKEYEDVANGKTPMTAPDLNPQGHYEEPVLLDPAKRRRDSEVRKSIFEHQPPVGADDSDEHTPVIKQKKLQIEEDVPALDWKKL